MQVSSTEFRAKFAKLKALAISGEPVYITSHGVVVLELRKPSKDKLRGDFLRGLDEIRGRSSVVSPEDLRAGIEAGRE